MTATTNQPIDHVRIGVVQAAIWQNTDRNQMGQFHHYSFHNVMLILAQRPGATHVAGFRTWLKLGRAVKKGENGIAIFAPMKIKPKSKDGGTSEEEEDRPPLLRFRIVHVFDIEQTEGEPLPEPARMSGDPRGALSALEAAIVAEGIDLEDVEDLGGPEGVSKGSTIQVLRSLEPAARFAKASPVGHVGAQGRRQSRHRDRENRRQLNCALEGPPAASKAAIPLGR